MSDNFDYAVQASFSVPHSGSDYSKADMVNVRGRTPQEFHQVLTEVETHCLDLIAKVGQSLRAVAAAGVGLGAVTVEHSQTAQAPAQAPNNPPAGNYPTGQQNGAQNGYSGAPANDPWGGGYGQQQQQQQQAPAPQSNGIPTTPPPHVGAPPQCSHGVKKFLAKPYKGGKPGYWMAWACPADKRSDPTAHDLEFIRTK